MAAKYRLSREGAARLDIAMRHAVAALGIDATSISASRVAVEEGLLEISDAPEVA